MYPPNFEKLTRFTGEIDTPYLSPFLLPLTKLSVLVETKRDTRSADKAFFFVFQNGPCKAFFFFFFIHTVFTHIL